eukprot:jgi/Mesvir1/271/Mv13607-RA.2
MPSMSYGCRFDDREVQSDMKHFPFKVVDQGGKPCIQIDNYAGTGKKKVFPPEEISAMVLYKMKDIAETHLGETVTNAVITVPAYFNDAQRQATKDAGTIAGLNVVRILNEPTAAAIAYGLDKKSESNIIVFDLGGGTFDVSILTIASGVIEVRATSGDTHLGGEDFDQRVMQHFIDLVKKKYGKDISNNGRALGKLRAECERAKRALSSQLNVRVEIEALVDGMDLSESISRTQFEKLNADLFNKVLAPIDLALKKASFTIKDIDDIVLVGGSTRIPKVQQIIQEYFKGKQLNMGLHPDEAVCHGAALQGGILSNAGKDENLSIVLLDVTPLSLGVAVGPDGLMAVIIPSNTMVPAENKDIFTTAYDNQRAINVRVFEGERTKVEDNHFLGEFLLTGILPAQRGVPKVEVKFEIDVNGILQVSAVDLASGSKNSISIKREGNQLTEEQILKMKEDAEKYAEEDKKARLLSSSRNSVEEYCYSIKYTLEVDDRVATKVGRGQKETVMKAVDECFRYVENRQGQTPEDYEKKLRELRMLWDPIVSKLYGGRESNEL